MESGALGAGQLTPVCVHACTPSLSASHTNTHPHTPHKHKLVHTHT